MKAFGYNKHGDASVQKIVEVPVPEIAGDAELRIKVKACGLNPGDVKRRLGYVRLMAPEKSWPVVIGYDFAGVVDAVGPGVKPYKPGDEVYGLLGSREHRGSCAEYTIAEQDKLALKPKAMSFDEAAALPGAALTALQMLRRAGMKAGASVVITGGAGGVGHFAVQLAKALGASRVVATASAPKHAVLKELGCDEVVDYHTQSLAKLYSSRPFDIGLDCVSEVSQLCKVVKPGGWVVSIAQGFSAKAAEEAGYANPSWLLRSILYLLRIGMERAVATAKVNFHCLFLQPSSSDLEELSALVDAGKVKAVVKVFEGLDKAADAMALVESGRATGKAVVKVA